MTEPTTEAGRQAVEMRGLFGGETKERAAEWVALIEAEARESAREPGLREAAQAYFDWYDNAVYISGEGLSEHLVALRAALASEDRPAPQRVEACLHGVPIAPAWTCGYCAPHYTEDDPDWAAMVSPINEKDGGHDDR